jgi:hypothetical protein
MLPLNACGSGRVVTAAPPLSPGFSLVLTFGITVTYFVRRREPTLGGDLGQKGVKIAACEGPLKRRGRALVVALEGKKTLF